MRLPVLTQLLEVHQISSAPLNTYVKEIERQLRSGVAGEHAYRPALKDLLETWLPELDIVAVNDAQRVACGAPDFAISRNASRESQTVGYAETKDIGTNLATVESSEQLERYLRGLDNLVLTDYLEFRWYVEGNLRLAARLGTLDRANQRIVMNRSSFGELNDLLAGFLGHQPPPITRAKELAVRLARPTHMIRNTITTAFARRRTSEVLRGLHQAFAEVLVPDLPVEEFADMFAQTLTYGLFAARVNHDPARGDFQRLGAANEIPRTNPFLRNLFAQITGPSLEDEPFAGFVDDLVQLLAQCDMGSVLIDFGRQGLREDSVVYFYETFLSAYSPELRRLRGVYYTPDPVVWYIVRSVDHLLKERFELSEGLADESETEYAVATYTDTPQEETEESSDWHRAPRVLILDPATGTGTFLYTVVALIRDRFMRSGNTGLWSSYVREQLLPRILGFELLMAPYAVAHLKLGMQLAGHDLPEDARQDWRYDFASSERLQIYLTNTLEEGLKQSEMPLGRFISQEANAAAAIKREMPIMVVLGNPPYSLRSEKPSQAKAKRNSWVGKLVDDYYEVDGQRINEQNSGMLQDDYVRFIRFGQWRIDRSGSGILAFITSHSYLTNPTFRGMRQHLLQTFSDIFILDLHGNVRRRERAPDGGRDQNVFNEVQQGVAIGIFVKHRQLKGLARVHHASLWGERNQKYSWLAQNSLENTEWTEVDPSPPHYLFAPQQNEYRPEYEQGWILTSIMQLNSTGVKTHRDKLVFDVDQKDLEQRIADFLSPDQSDEVVRTRYFGTQGRSDFLPGDNRDWRMAEKRSTLQKDPNWRKRIIDCLYRPFDVRSLFFHEHAVDYTRQEVMNHLANYRNIGLAVGRAGQVIGSDYWDILICSVLPTDHNLFRRGANNLFPLYHYPAHEGQPNSQSQLGNMSPWPEGRNGRRPNMDEAFVKELGERLGWDFVPDGRGNLGQMAPTTGGSHGKEESTFGPEDIFYYIYAVLHAPSYRYRYAEFLEIDFPRVPLTSDSSLFATLVHLGAKLVGLHTLDPQLAPEINRLKASYPIRGTDEVASGHPKYFPPGERDPRTGEQLSVGRVYINPSSVRKGTSGQYFEGVPPEVWEFHIGGYQVCEKWLKDRRGRTLSNDDLNHYRRIIVALQETIRTMEAIDDAIPGWPLPNNKKN